MIISRCLLAGALFSSLWVHPEAHTLRSQTDVGKPTPPALADQKKLKQQEKKMERPRARDPGLIVGVLPTGRHNSITDVAGVRVGHTTLIRDNGVCTGVTVVLPHEGNVFQQKVPGAVFTGNGFGKLMGSTQVHELGEIETPIALTSTLNVPRVADALLDYLLAIPENQKVRSINPLVAETNDGTLNDIQGRHVGRKEVLAAINSAKGGPVEEGCVGAGTGTIAFGFKGGIGTASRMLPEKLGGYTVGVLVQTNFGGILSIDGAPVGQELDQWYLRDQLRPEGKQSEPDRGDGSIIIVIATDAPVQARNLRRMAARSMLGLGRTGAAATNGSGDYAIAFSTAKSVRIPHEQKTGERYKPRTVKILDNAAMSPLFLAVIEATEEAIYNSLFRATTTTSRDRTIKALPIEKTVAILRKYGRIRKK